MVGVYNFRNIYIYVFYVNIKILFLAGSVMIGVYYIAVYRVCIRICFFLLLFFGRQFLHRTVTSRREVRNKTFERWRDERRLFNGTFGQLLFLLCKEIFKKINLKLFMHIIEAGLCHLSNMEIASSQHANSSNSGISAARYYISVSSLYIRRRCTYVYWMGCGASSANSSQA